MRVRCAWCLKAGKGDAEALIGEREPVADKRTSHGICEHHRRELEERVRLREEMRRQAERHDADVEDLRKNVDPAVLPHTRAPGLLAPPICGAGLAILAGRPHNEA